MADHRRRHQITTRNSKNNILHGVTLLILISADIAENPGPIKFPCGSCAKPVKKYQKGIQCEDCLFWYHIKCINLPVTYYITLSESSDSWYCSRCTLPEFTDSFFEKSKNENDIDKSAESDGYLPCDNSSTSGVNAQETHDHEDRVEDVFDELKNLRRKHPLQFMCAYLNINSLRYDNITEIPSVRTTSMPLTYLKGESEDKLKVREIDGYYTFPWEVLANHDDEFRSIPTWKARDDDVMICAYPKSGTHWTFEILNMLLSQKAERVKSYKQSGMLDYISQSQFDELPSPRVLNTHSLFSQLPVDFVNRKCKIILIMRNPKDVAVSFFHHHTGITKYEYEGNWEAYLPRFMQGLVDYNSWFDYAVAWEKTISDHPDYPIHVMYYEDMVENIHTEIYRLAQFLCVDPHCTRDFVNNIASLCSLHLMREEKVTAESVSFWKENTVGMYRKGIVGDWKTMFTVNQNTMFSEYYNSRMKDSKLRIRFTIPVKNSFSVFH